MNEHSTRVATEIQDLLACKIIVWADLCKTLRGIPLCLHVKVANVKAVLAKLGAAIIPAVELMLLCCFPKSCLELILY